MNKIVKVVMLGTVLLAGACGGQNAQEQAAPRSEAAAPSASVSPERQRLDDLDVCALLTETEIADALGAAPQAPGQGEVVFPNHQCDWRLPSEETFTAGILVTDDPGATTTMFQEMEETLAPSRTVSGLGEKAIFSTAAGVAGPEAGLVVRDGKAIVAVVYSEETVQETRLVQLVKKVLERIDQ